VYLRFGDVINRATTTKQGVSINDPSSERNTDCPDLRERITGYLVPPNEYIQMSPEYRKMLSITWPDKFANTSICVFAYDYYRRSAVPVVTLFIIFLNNIYL
jgi:hypothetical protein